MYFPISSGRLLDSHVVLVIQHSVFGIRHSAFSVLSIRSRLRLNDSSFVWAFPLALAVFVFHAFVVKPVVLPDAKLSFWAFTVPVTFVLRCLHLRRCLHGFHLRRCLNLRSLLHGRGRFSTSMFDHGRVPFSTWMFDSKIERKPSNNGSIQPKTRE